MIIIVELPRWLSGKSLPASAGDIRDAGWSLGQEDPLVEGIATCSSIQMVNQGDLDWEGWSLGWEDLLEEGMATHSSILAWRIPWTEEPGGLQSVGSPRVRHDWATTYGTTQHQRSCLGTLVDREAWQARVHRAPKDRTQLSDWTRMLILEYLQDSNMKRTKTQLCFWKLLLG